VPVPLQASPARLWTDIDALSGLREPGAPGWTRPFLSASFVRSRGWVAERMRAAGLEASVDAALNVIGVWPGMSPRRPALMTGSHTDTVEGGGRFDGVAGVVAAIEVVRLLQEAGLTLERDLVVVDFAGEEPNAFGLSCVGSRALSGQLEEHHLALRDPEGTRLDDALAAAGGDPAAAIRLGWQPGSIAAFVELHIEQGPILEDEGLDLGVVDSIVGIDRCAVELRGRPDHAGTTPARLRRDALCAAAPLITWVESAADAHGLGTVGAIEVEPGSLNVVPAAARLGIELRSAEEAWLDRARAGLEACAREAAERRGVEAVLSWQEREPPVHCDDGVREAIAQAVRDGGLTPRRMASGAGHDAAMIAAVAPTGMLFVPSAEGRSHAPAEWTDPEHLARGTEALARTLVALDGGSTAA